MSSYPTMEDFDTFHNVGIPSRFMGAKAALKEHRFWSKFAPFLIIFRVLELCANCSLLAIILWWIKPHIMVVPFILLWYLPAVFRTGFFTLLLRPAKAGKIQWWQPWLAPLQYPILLFVADDFSWLRIHPEQRRPVRMYAIYIVRVVLLLCIIPLCDPHGGLGGSCRAIINEDTGSSAESPLKQMHDAFDGVLVGSTINLLSQAVDKGHFVNFLTVLWSAISEAIIFISLLWVLISSTLLVLVWLKRVRVDRNEDLLRRVGDIAGAIESAARMKDPLECRQRLRSLPELDRAVGGCDTFELVSPFRPPSTNPVLVGVLYTVNSCVRLLNVYTYASSLTWNGLFCSLVLLGHVVLTTLQAWRLGMADPRAVLAEVKLSLARGIFTPKLFELLKSDKGALTLPALVFSLSSLPWTIYLNHHEASMQAVMAVGQVLGVVGLTGATAVFVFEQFDLGVEREGKGYAPRHLCDI